MVGYTLRQERERQNLSISDIEQGTSIRALYIEAIEAGEYDKLPGAVYTKGFIKNYAKFLGMDAEAAAKEFANDLAEVSAENQAAEAQQTTESDKPAPEKKVEQKLKGRPVGYSLQNNNRSSSGLLIVAAVVLIAAIAGGLWSWLSSSDGDVATVNPPQQQTQPVAPEPTPTTDPTPVASANPEPEQPKTPSDKVAIQARFNDRCWALVTVDGAVVQEGVIEGGQTLSWEGKENVTFRLGNAGAVEFFQDGKSLGIQGGVGDVVDKTFTRS